MSIARWNLKEAGCGEPTNPRANLWPDEQKSHKRLAADDPVAVVNNLSTFIFGLIRAVGLILLGFGIVQVGLSLKSHDPSQRANGFLTVAGGIVITFAKEILDLIVG